MRWRPCHMKSSASSKSDTREDGVAGTGEGDADPTPGNCGEGGGINGLIVAGDAEEGVGGSSDVPEPESFVPSVSRDPTKLTGIPTEDLRCGLKLILIGVLLLLCEAL
jgi:hypothetical protein